jgi:two-component system chemotaxis sensor kinase CheA
MSDEIVREFLVEGNENLDTLDRELVQLEKDPQNRATLASVFRTIHTIKGTCGFLGFTKLEAVAHVGENLLSRLRDLELLLNPDITTALLRMVDAVRQMMQSIEAIGSEGERNVGKNAQQVATASEEFSATSQQITANSEETSAQANVVSAATEEINRNLQPVSASSDRMSATISEIAKNAGESAKVAGEALRAAVRAAGKAYFDVKRKALKD